MNKYLTVIIAILLSFFSVNTAKGCDNHIPVRVGISDTNFQNYLFREITFNSANNLNITDAASGYSVPVNVNSSSVKITKEGNLFRIYLDGELKARNLSGPITISSVNGGVTEPVGIKRKGKQATYRGIMELVGSTKEPDKFAIVNVLSLRNYLKGVVPNEMPVKFGLEALKAQTVAARNYAIAPRVKAYEEFDVCDSVACQVYFGAGTEAPLSNRAVEETNGIIAADNKNNPILALYSSTAGGYTESYEFAFSDPKTKAFPSHDIHYLRAVPDYENFGNLSNEKAAEEFYKSAPPSFDDNSPYFRWSKDWTSSELEGILKKTLVAQSKTGFVHPALTNPDDFGKLQSVKVLQRGVSGKIIKLAIYTDKNTFVVEKELVIRRCFPKNEISLPSANFVITKIESENPVYKFNGGGFGHGVGLSQWGAGKMASLGYSFEQILKHYYRGIKLTTVPVNVYASGKKEERNFYIDGDGAVVHLEHNGYNEDFVINVNGNNIPLKIGFHETHTDISKYIVKGINKISYTIKDKKDRSGKVKAYIEIIDGK